MTLDTWAVRRWVEGQADEFFGALKEWLAIPSISGDPAHADDVRRSAEWLAGQLRRAGFPTAEAILPDDRIHAPNEKVEMGLLLKAAESAAYLWDDLASAP